MALSLYEKDTLTTNATQLARTRQACREYARYLADIGEAATDEQAAWARQVLETGRVAQIAADMQGELVTDAKFSNATEPDATDVVDVEFKAAVEAICLKYT